MRSEAVGVDALRGRVVAIDAPNLLYAFYTAQLQHADPTPAVIEQARGIAHRGLLARVLDLAELGARSVLVLDGAPHPLKRALLEKRDATRTMPRLLPEQIEPTDALCRALCVPVVQAPHDAEAQAAAMAIRGQVDVVATTDWDAFAMGAPLLLRNLSSRRDGANRAWSLVSLQDALAALDVPSREAFAAAAVLMGCDYSPGIKGIGPKKAAALVRSLGHLEACLDAIPLERDPAGEALALPHWREALAAFLEPAHMAVPSLEWGEPDREALWAALARIGTKADETLRARLARIHLLHTSRELNDEDWTKEATAGQRAAAARLAQEERRRRDPAQQGLGGWIRA